MKKTNNFFKYFKQYKWSNVSAMLKNNRSNPKVCKEDIKDKLVVITGATSGIGYHTARKFAFHKAHLLLVNRNIDKSEALCRELKDEFGIKCEYMIADLSNLKDVHRIAKDLATYDKPIDILIHNAGVYLTKRELTSDGLEKVFVVNYLSSFIINYVLMKKLKAQKEARIILVGSEGHRFAMWGIDLDDLNWGKRRYGGLASYGSAKMAQLLSMLVFTDHFKDTGVTINVVHPGAVKSNTGQENGPIYKWFKRTFLERNLKSPDMSAEAIYYLGVSEKLEKVTGKFFNLTTPEDPAPPACDKEVALELWKKSIKLGKLKDN